MNGSTPANEPDEYPDTLYVRIDDMPNGEEDLYAERAPRDLADVSGEVIIGVYRLEYLAVLTTTATLTPYPTPRNGPHR